MATTPTTPNPIRADVSLSNSTGKTVALVIGDVTALTDAALVAAGEGNIAQAVALISDLVLHAFNSYESGATVEITPDAITALLPDETPLAPAIDANVSPTVKEAIAHVQSRGYSAEAAAAIVEEHGTKAILASKAADAASATVPDATGDSTAPTAEPAPAPSSVPATTEAPADPTHTFSSTIAPNGALVMQQNKVTEG